MIKKTISIKEGDYLSSKINSLPCGKIHKIATGIGATTLEIRDKTRNSLIVCPTRALAGSKAIAEKIFYIGSKYGSLKPTSIDRIKKNIKNKKLTKVAVVSDSLVPLLNDLGKEAYKDFFIMFDEIDAYQSEISYRPRLEEAFEEYFKFPKDRRCMVSATLQEFSDDRLVGEPQTEIIIDSQQKPGINIIEYSDNKYATIKAYIESIRKCQFFQKNIKQRRVFFAVRRERKNLNQMSGLR